jgi:sugar phosphate permease
MHLDRRTWRIIVFSATWFAYAAYYMTRKNYAVAQPAFMQELGWSKVQVGTIITGYLTLYAIGQVVNGVLGDRIGSRWVLAGGMALTAILSAALGFAESIPLMALLYGLNGYAQSAGWPSTTRAMRNWTPIAQRGSIMGVWGTCYSAGDAAATAFAAFVLGSAGWRAVFWIPSAVVLIVGVVVTIVLRDHPRDVGLAGEQQEPTTRPFEMGRTLSHLRDPRVMTIGLAYFCVKFVRYTFIFWIGVYLVERMGFTAEQAGYMQVPFPLFGVAGSIVAGLASDKLFGARRAPVCVIMLLTLAAAILVFLVLPKSSILVSANLALIGFMTFGPDMLLSAAAAMDFGSEEAAATVLGTVNGIGSIGGAVSGSIVGWISQEYGWNATFQVLVAMTMICVLITLTLWNARGD